MFLILKKLEKLNNIAFFKIFARVESSRESIFLRSILVESSQSFDFLSLVEPESDEIFSSRVSSQKC